MQLEYVPASAENGAGGVIINRGGMDADSVVWKTGAFAGAKETITAPVNVCYKANDDLMKSDDETVNLKSGILFAVVLKRDKKRKRRYQKSEQLVRRVGRSIDGSRIHPRQGAEQSRRYRGGEEGPARASRSTRAASKR